jgi:hypothetical protein
MSYKHFRDEHVVPGWICCQCRTYNGYQRGNCRNCNHAPCYETKSKNGREALELKPIGASSDLVRIWMEKHG